MSWTKGRARVKGAKATRAKVLKAYPICACAGCEACERDRIGPSAEWTLCFRASTRDDHVVPVAEGGTEDMSNHRGMCSECHDVKSRIEAVRGRLRALKKMKMDGEDDHPGLLKVR